MTTIEQNIPQDDKTNRQRQSPCPSNWSDYLHVADDTDNESTDQADPLTDPNQPTTSLGTQVPQDLHTDANAIVRLLQSVPQVLTMQKGKGKVKGKRNNTEAMPIVVVDNATQLWQQIPSPPKTRPPYVTWALVKPQRQVQDDTENEQN